MLEILGYKLSKIRAWKHDECKFLVEFKMSKQKESQEERVEARKYTDKDATVTNPASGNLQSCMF